MEKPRWHCEQDAQRAADRLHAKQPFTTLTLNAVVTQETVADKRNDKGRANKNAPAPQTRYRLVITIHSADGTGTDARLRRAATNVLIRNRLTGWELTDEEMVAAYSDQWKVEHGFAWLKSGAAINPMYLESPQRITALSMIYHIALMIHTLIQRGIRTGLKERQWEPPTTAINHQTISPYDFSTNFFATSAHNAYQAPRKAKKRYFGMGQHTQRALVALGVDPQAYQPVINESEK